MELIYVSGPIRVKDKDGKHVPGAIYGMHLNMLNAERVAAELWKEGYAVICPHKNTENFDGYVTDEQFLNGDLKIIWRCDAVVMLDGWVRSEGCLKEYEFAVSHNIPVSFWHKDDYLWENLDNLAQVLREKKFKDLNRSNDTKAA